jgi:hypothetical protein
MRVLAIALALLIFAPPAANAAPTDDVANAVSAAVEKSDITPDSLPADFARLTRFVRHEASGMVLFTDGGATDGYVRHAQAQFAKTAGAPANQGKAPLFSVALEFVDQPDFSFEGLSAALEKRLGPPTTRSDQSGATFRTWLLKQPEGRTMTVARAQASDNGDPITIVYIIQK